MAGDLVYGSNFEVSYCEDTSGQVFTELTPVDGDSVAITLSSWRAQVIEPLVAMGLSEGDLPSYPNESNIDLDDVRTKNTIVLEAMARMPLAARSDLISFLLRLGSQGKLFYHCRA